MSSNKVTSYTKNSRDLEKLIELKKLSEQQQKEKEAIKLRQLAYKEQQKVEKGLLPPNKAFHLIIVKQQELYVKTLPLLRQFDYMLDKLMELSPLNFYDKELAKFVKILKNKTEQKLDKDLFCNQNIQDQYYAINKQMQRLDDNIQKIDYSKFEELNTILEYWIENGNVDIESVCNKTVDKKYLTLNQLTMDTGVKNKLKQFSTKGIDVLDIPLIQLAVLIPKDKLEKTKGFGAKSIEVLENVFEEVLIEW